MRNEGETLVPLAHQAEQTRREAEAWQVVNGLIQGHVGPDHKIINMQSFSSALMQALKAARMRGEDDAGDVLTLT
jgi:hypothetical protein